MTNQTYIGLKVVAATPMCEVDAIAEGIARDRTIEPTASDPLAQRGRDGYRVLYGDNYVSWSPATVFEQDYVAVDGQNAPHILLALHAELESLNNRGLGPDTVTALGNERHIPSEQDTRSTALFIARDSAGGQYLDIKELVRRADDVYSYLTTGTVAAPAKPEAYDPSDKVLVTIGTLMEALSALYGSRAVVGDIANITHAIGLIEGETGLEYRGFSPPGRKPADIDFAGYVTTEADQLLTADAALRATFDISTPIDALRMCAETFRSYEKHHLAKIGIEPHPEDVGNRGKARRNGVLALMCERIIENDAEVLRVMGGAPATFRDDLARTINRWSMENGSDTPDFILADFLQDVLLAFDGAHMNRTAYYGGRGTIRFAPKETRPMHGIDTDPPLGGKSFPLYQLRREPLDTARAALLRVVPSVGLTQSDIDEAIQAIDAAIIERDTPPPAATERSTSEGLEHDAPHALNPGGGEAGFVVGKGFEGGEYGQPVRPD